MNAEHEHEWVELPDDVGGPGGGPLASAARFGCRECTAVVTACETCGRPNESANRACERCIKAARRVLDDIDEASRTPFAAEVLGVRAIRYDRGGGKGGGRRVESLPFGLDAVLVDPDSPEEIAKRAAERPDRVGVALLQNPAEVLDALTTWADQWAEKLETSWCPTGPPSASGLLRWLAQHLVWAANNPELSDWPEYLEEARAVRSRLRRLVGLAPEIEPAPCVECGGQVVRDWTRLDGLSDARRCTRCGTRWTNQQQLDFVNLTTLRALPRTKPDELVTADMAKAALPTSRRAQLRLVLHRDAKRVAAGKLPRIPTAGTDERGRPLYRLGDVWIASDPDAGVTAAEAIAAVPPAHRARLAWLLAVEDPDREPELEPRGTLTDGTRVWRLGTVAEAAAETIETEEARA